MSSSTLAAPPRVLLTPPELADRWRCSVGHLANLRHRAQGPEYLKLHGGSVLYDLVVIEAYEAARVVAPLSTKSA